MGICRDCEHWRENVDNKYAIVPIGWGRCALSESGNGFPNHEDSRAFATDEDEFTAYLVTAPDFGCNQFEERA